MNPPPQLTSGNLSYLSQILIIQYYRYRGNLLCIHPFSHPLPSFPRGKELCVNLLHVYASTLFIYIHKPHTVLFPNFKKFVMRVCFTLYISVFFFISHCALKIHPCGPVQTYCVHVNCFILSNLYYILIIQFLLGNHLERKERK